MWLDPDVPFHTCFQAIMNSTVYEGLSFYEVSELVNSVKHDSPDVVLPKKEYD
jgi:putative SOS response-associated peptidase YedK